MFSKELAQIYEAFYRAHGKDWDAEVAEITALVRARLPGARSLLDVACGTGLHLAAFGGEFDRVAGVEYSPDMLAVARQRLSGVPLYQVDMCHFALDEKFDVVCCLFGSIGYVNSPADLLPALNAMASHLTPGGILVVQPWIFAEAFVDGTVSGQLVRADSQVIARTCLYRRAGSVALGDMAYLVADPDGVRHFKEEHRLMLWSCDEYRAAFREAGCDSEYLPEALSGAGLLIGIRQ